MKIDSMMNKFKFVIGLIYLTVVLVIASPYTNMFGKQYNKNMDFSCCKKNQIVLHHYYTTRVFWVSLNKGYDLEPIGKPSSGCNVSCD